MAKTSILFCLLVFLVGSFGGSVRAQTTEFSYQGSLTNTGSPANGNFDFEFRLFNALSGGSQAGATLTRNNVAVANGVFSVSLDFGANFPGADRFLEIAVKPAGAGKFTLLAPRSPFLSVPYAIRSASVGPITGASTSAMLLVTNSQPGINNPSPSNVPPSAITGEATSTTAATIGVLGISNSASGGGVLGLFNGTGEGSAVVGITTSVTGDAAGVASNVSSPNGRAFEASMPSGGSGYLFFGSAGKASRFTVDSAGNTDIEGSLSVSGSITLGNPVSTGMAPVCRDSQSRLANCSSSLRYKTDVARFASGTQLIKRLQPITFNWKDGGMHDLGLGAEDVAAVEPLLVTYNDKGQVEGVKYDRVGVVLINAIKEQQAQIELQRAEIEALKALVCANSSAEVCKKKEK